MIIPQWLKVYGDPTYRNKKCPKEDAELKTFVNQVRKINPDVARVLLHINNEGKRRHDEVNDLKAKGSINPGASDIIIPGKPCFVLEMKRKDMAESDWQPGQVDYLKQCQDMGCFVCLALGYESALMAFNEWCAISGYKKQANGGCIAIDEF